MKRRVWLNGIVVVGLLLALVGATGASRALSDAAPLSTLDDDVHNYNTPYREAPNVVDQFNSVQNHGDHMGVWTGEGDEWSWCSGFPCSGIMDVGCKHYQGLARGTAQDGTPYFFLTRSGKRTDCCPEGLYLNDQPGELLIVEMGSNEEKNGERLRSNLLDKDVWFEKTEPPDDDRGVVSIHLDGWFQDEKGTVWPDPESPKVGYMHPSGVALIDDVLVVPAHTACIMNDPFHKEPNEGRNCDGDSEKNGIMLIDVSEPPNPWLILHHDTEEKAYDAVAATRVPNGESYSYLLALIWGCPDACGDYLDFMEPQANGAPVTDLRDTTDLKLLATWEDDDSIEWWENWQNLGFVRESGSEHLYLIGLTKIDDAKDYIRLFEVDEDQYDIEYVAEKHLKLGERPLNPSMGNLAAAGGIYVSPTGQLIVYSADYCPNSNISHATLGEKIEMGEFRSIYVSHTGRCGPQWQDDHLGGPYSIDEGSSLELNGEVYVIEPWVHMFAEHDFNADNGGNTSLMMDWTDRNEDDFRDFRTLTKNGQPFRDQWFDEYMSSFTFCGPQTSTLEIYEKLNYEGYSIHCDGTGNVIGARDVSLSSGLGGCQYVDGSPHHDWASSAKIEYEPPAQPYSWSLSRECEGCLTISEDGSRAKFSGLDGPCSCRVTLEYSGYPHTESTTICVHNVLPTVELTGHTSANESNTDTHTYGLAVSDPGEDTFEVLHWTCGDNGTTSGISFDQEEGEGSFACQFPEGPVISTVGIQVQDSDNAYSDYGMITVDIENEAPEITAGGIDVQENGVTTISGTITDRGIHDTFAVTFNWGEGMRETFWYPAGTTEYNQQHQYLDDNPTSSAKDPYEISISIRDDDEGEGSTKTSVWVSNRNPDAIIDSITDELGAEIGSDVPVALVHLEVNAAGSFSDIGTLDTHTARMEWGDGAFDDLGAVVATTQASHVYEVPGVHTMILTITDDDTGTGVANAQIEVADAQDAVNKAIEVLKLLVADPNVADALDKLQSEQSGALGLLAKGNQNAALEKIQQALQALESAQGADPIQLTHVKGLLAQIAKSVSLDAIQQAEAVGPKPQDLAKIRQATGLVAQGDALLKVLESPDYVGAVGRYQEAVREVQGIY